MGDRELKLVRDQGLLHVALQELDLPGGVVRDAERPHLARRVELLERPRNLRRLDEGVGPVKQEDVDAVRAERGERVVNGFDDVLVRVVEVRPVGHDPDLGLEDEPVALRRGEAHRVADRRSHP